MQSWIKSDESEVKTERPQRCLSSETQPYLKLSLSEFFIYMGQYFTVLKVRFSCCYSHAVVPW